MTKWLFKEVSLSIFILLVKLKSGKNIIYTFAIWTLIVNVYIIFLPDFISSEYMEELNLVFFD